MVNGRKRQQLIRETALIRAETSQVQWVGMLNAFAFVAPSTQMEYTNTPRQRMAFYFVAETEGWP